jgi:hypothetical protein
MSLCEINQRELMKLFKENVKTDISHTNDIIDLIQKKLQDFDLNLDSLKTSTTELNKDFAVIEKKITSLDTSFKRVNSYSSLSRSESVSSIASSYSLDSSAFSDYLTESSTESDLESDTDNELESTFVIVTKDEKTNNILMEDQQPCLTSNDLSEADPIPSTIEQLRKKEYQLIDRNCNQLIELLIKNASK